MEVLISATVFMIGLSILIAVMSSSLTRFSTQEIEAARCVGQEMLARTIALSDTAYVDTLVNISGVDFRVIRHSRARENLAEVSLSVSRESSGRKLVDLYYELPMLDK